MSFSDSKYVGDPINAVKIFNEKEVDEIIVLDIDATVRGESPDIAMIANLAAECRMPLCYGGGIKTAEQAKTIIGLGVEKVAISSAALEDSDLITRMVVAIGSQSVVVVLDAKPGQDKSSYEVYTHNAKVNTGRSLAQVANEVQALGAGEIVVNSIDNDGQMNGYDLGMAKCVHDATSVPVTVLGGAGSPEDIGKLIAEFGVIGAAAGSMFVFKGIYRAVLINYPSVSEHEALILDNLNLSQAGWKCDEQH